MSSQFINLPSGTLTLHINRGVLVGKPVKKNYPKLGKVVHTSDASSKDTKSGVSL